MISWNAVILKGRYRIEERVSHSSSSVVYKGVDLQEQTSVAVKKINYHPFYFDSEMNSLKNLIHPSVIRLMDAFQDKNDFYLVTEWFEGHALSEGSFSLEEWVDVFVEILKGLQYIHENGITHRDLKPQNILIGENRQVKIIDFGISVFQKELDDRDPKILGTLPYMPPEQTGYIQAQTDQRSDIYSLGIIFYECLTGSNPFAGKDKSEIIHKHLSFLPTPLKEMIKSDRPRVLKGISAIAAKMMEKDPDKRYSSVAAILEDLEKLLTLKFPFKHRDSKVLFRQDLIQDALSRIPVFLNSEKKMVLIRGKFGTGKSFIFKKLMEEIKLSRPVLEMKVVDLSPFAFLQRLFQELGYSMKDLQRINELEFPVLAVENLQRIDEPSWNYLIQRKKLLILGTYDEDEEFPVLKNLNFPLESFQALPCSKEEMGQVIRSMFKDGIELSSLVEEKIYDFCQGNPAILFYLFQLFYDEKVLICRKDRWVFEKPEKIFSAVEDADILNYRFSALEEDLKSFLKDAAVYGFSFYLENLKRVTAFTGVKPAELKRLLKKAEEHSILEKNHDAYTFMNRNIHQYFYSLTPPEERKRRHLKIARTVERIKNFDNRFFPLFYHYSRAEEPLKAYIWGNRLLIDLVQKYAYHQAIEVFEQLVSFFEQVPDKNEGDFLHFFELLQKMVNIYVFKGSYDRLIEILKDQQVHLKGRHEEEKLAFVYMSLGRLYALKGSIQESLKWYHQVLTLAESIKNPRLLAGIYENISMNYLFSSRFREAIRFFEKAQHFYQPDDYQDPRMVTLLGVMAFAYANLGFFKKSEQLLEQLEKSVDNEKNPHVRTIGIHYRILVLSHSGQIRNLKEEFLEDCLKQVREQENRLLEYSLYFSVGYYYYKKRKLHKAFQYISQSVKIGENLRVGVGILAPYLVLSEVGIRLKRYAQIKSYFPKMKELIAQNKDYFSLQWFLRLKALLLSYSVGAREDRVKEAIEKAIHYAHRLRLKPEIARNYYYYSMISFNLGDFEKGQVFEKRAMELFSQLNMEWEQEEIKSMVMNQTIQTTQLFFGEKVRLEALSKVNQLIAKQKNAEELLFSIMQSAIEISGATRGALFLKNGAGVMTGYFSGLNENFQIPEKILESLETGKEPYLNSPHDKKSFIYLPLRFKEQLLGVVYLENDLIANVFNSEQVKVMNILSAIFGVLLENARAYRALEDEKKNLEHKVEERTREVYLRSQVIEKDLAAARNFQENLMPKKIPEMKNIRGSFYYQPVEEIGGDFYDFIPISDTRMLFVIADSAGHGIRASLLTAMLKTALFNYPDKTYQSIRDLMEHINNSLYGQISDKYIVCLIGVVDSETGTVSMMGGGNISLYHFQARGSQWERIPMKGHMLGIIPTRLLQFSEKTFALFPGDKLFLTTDGMIEQYVRDAEGNRQIFGEDKLKETLEKYTDSDSLLIDAVKELRDFSKKKHFSDDITAILFWRTE